MNKTVKRLISIVLIIAVLCGAVWGGLILIRNAQKKPVNVYSVSDFAMTDDYSTSSQTYGMVTMDHMQKILLTETQTVKEVFVKEGQTVKKGDKLLSYDTTLTDIDLEKARIELNKLKLQKTTAENDLAKYKKMKPHSSVLITPPSSNITYTPQTTPMLLGGSGTMEDPFYYLWSDDDALEDELLSQMFPGSAGTDQPAEKPDETDTPETKAPESTAPETTEPETKAPETTAPESTTPETKAPETNSPESTAPESSVSHTEDPAGDETSAAPDVSSTNVSSTNVSGANASGAGTSATPSRAGKTEIVSSNESYVVLVVRENNALNGQVLSSTGLHLSKSGKGIQIRFFQASLPEHMLNYDSTPEPYYKESGSDYTASELTQMKREKEQEIKDLEVSIKIAELELKQKEKETSDGTVLSTIDGTVKVLRDPNEAFQNSEPVMEVSAGGGYYIDGALSELELETVQTGQTVQVSSWSTGTYCDGEIVEISTYPTTNAESYSSNGNTNVSYYPFRVFVDESANLVENDYVEVSYQNQVQEDGSSSFYLENPFVRTENGQSYVYIRNEEGLLEQRTVQTGKDLYGYYTEIRGGLTMDDYIAFPYGNDVTDGAKTNESTPDILYEY